MKTPDWLRWEARRLLAEARSQPDAAAKRPLLIRAFALAQEAEGLEKAMMLKPAGGENQPKEPQLSKGRVA
jgi:hypothetical protein